MMAKKKDGDREIKCPQCGSRMDIKPLDNMRGVIHCSFCSNIVFVNLEELRKVFERLRRAKLEAVVAKHKDDLLDFVDCHTHLQDETGELYEAVVSGDKKRIEEELLDIANCAEFTFIALRMHEGRITKHKEEGGDKS